MHVSVCGREGEDREGKGERGIERRRGRTGRRGEDKGK